MTITQNFTTPPTAPDPDDPTTFEARAALYVPWMGEFQGELAAWTAQANGLGSDMQDAVAEVRGADGAWWKTETATVAYASASTFTVSGVDATARYQAGAAVNLDQTTDKVGRVTASEFSGGNTTVTVNCAVDSGLTSVAYGQPTNAAPNPGGEWNVESDTTITSATAYVEIGLVADKENLILLDGLYHDGGSTTSDIMWVKTYAAGAVENCELARALTRLASSATSFSLDGWASGNVLCNANVGGSSAYSGTGRIEVLPNMQMSGVFLGSYNSSNDDQVITHADLTGIDKIRVYFNTNDILGGHIVHATR